MAMASLAWRKASSLLRNSSPDVSRYSLSAVLLEEEGYFVVVGICGERRRRHRRLRRLRCRHQGGVDGAQNHLYREARNSRRHFCIPSK